MLTTCLLDPWQRRVPSISESFLFVGPRRWSSSTAITRRHRPSTAGGHDIDKCHKTNSDDVCFPATEHADGWSGDDLRLGINPIRWRANHPCESIAH